MLRSFMLALALLASSGSARAEPLRTPDDVRALTQAIMERLSKGKINEASQMATPHCPLPGNELVREDRAGEWARRMTYVEKRERHMIRWQFTFYRPQNAWLMNGLTFDDNMQTLFEK